VVFSRDCPDFEVHTPSGPVLHLLVNHFTSQSGGGAKGRRQAEKVRSLVDDLVARDQHVMVLGDLNEGQPDPAQPPPNLTALFTPDGPLTSCYDLDGFDSGPRPGSFDTCSLRNRLDYILISASLRPTVTGGDRRNGLPPRAVGSRRTRPTAWPTTRRSPQRCTRPPTTPPSCCTWTCRAAAELRKAATRSCGQTLSPASSRSGRRSGSRRRVLTLS
jgi:hypothetical protein